MSITKDFIVKNGLQVGLTGTFSNTISVTGSATFSNAVTITGNLNVANITSNVTFSNNVTITGNLIVTGSAVYINASILDVSDNFISLVANLAPAVAPTLNAGIEINRGSSANVQFRTIGVGTTPDSANNGSIRAINNITSYYSDDRLKTKLGNISNALDKVLSLNGYYFVENQKAKELGYNNSSRQVGVSAQEVEAVLPEVVADAPINNNVEGADYKTVYYEKLIPLLIEAIKEQQKQIDELKNK